MTDISQERCDHIATALRRVALDHMVGGGVEGEAAEIITVLCDRLVAMEAERGRLVAKLGRQISDQLCDAINARAALQDMVAASKPYEDDMEIANACSDARDFLARAGVCNASEPEIATPLQRLDEQEP